MDQIICDICGTEYSAAGECCPVCEYPRQGNEKAAAAGGTVVRTRVRGGRFSSKNVRRRNRERLRLERGRSDRGLWVTIILLLIAIMLVSAYIAMRFFSGWGSYTGGAQSSTRSTTGAAAADTGVQSEPDSALVLDMTEVELQELGQQVRITLINGPETGEDVVRFTAADVSVAQVQSDGVVTAVGPGQTTITVTCGGRSAECVVTCRFRQETTVPPETTQPVGTSAPAELRLDHADVSLFQTGEAFTIKVLLGESYIGRSQVEWTSSDDTVASVEKGVVTAVGPGTATITARYQGMTAQCIVRCQFRDTEWRASSTDVTLTVGESFRLSVINNSGETADAVWSMDVQGVAAVEDGIVTALAVGTVTLSATVDGVTVWCIVRVK